MLPEERAREKIDRQLKKAGWEIVSREEYTPHSASAVKEGLMQGNTESDYLLFVDDKAIAVVEAKREETRWRKMCSPRPRAMPLIRKIGMVFGMTG